MPNVGLEDESPSSKSDESSQDANCNVETVVNDGTVTATVSNGQSCAQDLSEIQRSPLHQTLKNGERRRRKLPEIPKNRKCK